ncbi:MAG TPA: zinc ribbon domain-containing protein [Candidatus Paceibacterota bacterium]|nr:zinc ribbon domain-containing protein [Candidatus Paceibacterota bacterium]
MQITSFLRKIANVPEIEAEHVGAEIGEKRTTLLGYILLTAMVLAGIWQGQTLIDKIAANVKQPDAPSSCAYALKHRLDSKLPDAYASPYNYPYVSDFLACKPSAYETSNGLGEVFAKLEVLAFERNTAAQKINDLENGRGDANILLDRAKTDYDLMLQEKQARVAQPVFQNGLGLQNTVIGTSADIKAIEAQLTPLRQRVKEIDAEVKTIAESNREVLSTEFASYERALAWANTLRALLELLLITPLFWFALRRYFIAAGKRSFTAIIWTAITTIFALLFAQVIAVFIYDIIPHALIEVLIKLFAQFKFIATIAQYLLLLLVPALFGGVVYLIQKRVYGGRAVYLRAMKNMKCPNCSMHLRDNVRFCPVCGFQVKEKCPSCGADRYKGLEHCDQCGVKA